MSLLEKKIEFLVNIFRFIQYQIGSPEFHDSMPKAFQLQSPFLHISFSFFYIRTIDEYIGMLGDRVHASACKSILKSIENMDKYTVILFCKRSEMRLFR